MFEIYGKYTNAKVFADICEAEAIAQIQELCNHPAFKDASIRIMPDTHSGAGCVIGTTAVLKEKKIIPNVVGVDINCGVMTTIFEVNTPIDFKALDNFIFTEVPSGMDVRTKPHKELNPSVSNGIKGVVSSLNLGDADRHICSVGTLGGGNHYIEIGKISDNRYALSVHTGSRNFGKKVCEYFQKKAEENFSGKNKLSNAISTLIADLKSAGREKEINAEIQKLKENFQASNPKFSKELAYIEGSDYEDYIRCMAVCALMANESRRLISKDIIDFLGARVIEQFDTIHNYIEQLPDGTIVIRKGAISAKKGEKVAIPLNMKDGVIIGIGKGNNDWNCSAPHGAGRLLSRSKAKESLSLDDFKDEMKNINSWSVCSATIDESPMAYKPSESIIEQVKDTIDIVGIIKPIYNFKAHGIEKTWAEIKKEEK